MKGRKGHCYHVLLICLFIHIYADTNSLAHRSADAGLCHASSYHMQ